MWKLLLFTAMVWAAAGIAVIPARASATVEEDEGFSTTERGKRLYKKLKPWLGVIANGTGGRGNGDAVWMKDGSLRFVDILGDWDLSQVVRNPRKLHSEFDDECTEESIEPFELDEKVEKEIDLYLKRLVKSLSPEFGLWFANIYYQTLATSVFSNYHFPTHGEKWARSTRLPEEVLIPVDFFTGFGTVFLKPVYERLSAPDRAAALVHAALRKGLAYYVAGNFQSRLPEIEEATRKIVWGRELETLNRSFGIDQGLFLRQEVVRWAQALDTFAKDLSVKGKISKAQLQGLTAELKSFRQKYFSGQPEQMDAFRMAIEIQTVEEFKLRSKLAPDRPARWAEWNALIQESGQLNNLLSSIPIGKSSEGKTLSSELVGFDQDFRKVYFMVVGNSMNGTQKIERSLPELVQLYFHPAIKPILCPMFNSLLSVDTAKDPHSLDPATFPEELRQWMGLQ